MDNLHVNLPTDSKSSSRSTSPCRTQQHHNRSSEVPQRPMRYRSSTAAATASSNAQLIVDASPTNYMDSLSTSVDDGGGGEADLSIPIYSPILTSSNNNNNNTSTNNNSMTLDELRPEDSSDLGTGVLDPKLSNSLERLGNKMVRVRDLMRTEQQLRDDNVNEYLKLAANADKQQVQRIKAVFEKKNQKSAQMISQLQKKLDFYQKRVYELETFGAVQGHKPTREMLRDMGQGLKNVGGNIRDGITGFSGSVMAKPREFAHLIKNKFGSADNISQLSSTWYVLGPGGAGSESSGGTATHPGSDKSDNKPAHQRLHSGAATLPANLHSSVAAASSPASQQQQTVVGTKTKFPSDEGSECSSVTSDSIGRFGSTHDQISQQETLKTIFKQLTGRQEEADSLKTTCKTLSQEVQFLSAAVQEERFRSERLEEQINDLTELHQNEVENLRQTMADMEEKVQYQSEERIRDIHEILEHCQTKIQKMEHQALQQQQYVTLDGLDNSNARALVVKLINILLTVLQVVLLLVATGAGIIMPFLRTRVRTLTTVCIVFAAGFILRQWPEVYDIGTHVMKRIKDTLEPVK